MNAQLPNRNRSTLLTTTLALLLMSLMPSTSTAAYLEDRIVAVVNSDLIMLSDVQREIEPERVRIARQYQGEELAARVKQAEFMALTRMIEQTLQLQEATAKKIEVSDKEAIQAAEQMKLQGKAVDPSNPLDIKKVRERLTLTKLVDTAIRSKITVGDSEMKRYYVDHIDRFAFPEEYSLRQILVQVRDPDEVAEASANAQEAMEALKHGETFEDVAVRYSNGPNASLGGRLGVVHQGELLPAIERAIATLVPGGISDIIEGPDGFHIIQLEEKSPRQFRPFEEVKTEIQGLIFQQKSEELFQAWLDELKNKALIEIKF